MKINLLIKSSVCAAVLFMCSYSNAQSNDWQLMKTQNGIEVYSRIISCDTEGSTIPFDYLVFKVKNTTSQSLNVSLQFEIHFEEGCNGCENSRETSTEISLNSGESIEASCSNFEYRLAYLTLNPNFQGSWSYSHSEVLIQTIN
jgi:hypothetical protein